MNVAQSTLAALRKAIVRSEIEPDHLVTETWVCDQFSVARPTAKSAIDRLVVEGLLRRDVNRPARVTSLNPVDIEDLYEARRVIEVEAIARLATLTAVPPALRRAQRLMIASDDDMGDFIEADASFHSALVGAAGSQRLANMHELLMGETRLCMARVRRQDLLNPDDIISDHEALLESIEAGSPEAARELLIEHIRWAKRSVIGSGAVMRQSSRDSLR